MCVCVCIEKVFFNCVYTVSFCTISVPAQIGIDSIRIISIVDQILRTTFLM